MSMEDDLNTELVCQRVRDLKAVRRTCGHDVMSQLHRIDRSLWQCQACGEVQRADDAGNLHMPGTPLPPRQSPALGTELAAWDSPVKP